MAQLIAILIAAAGVGYLILKVGQVPWIALALAITFGIYGVIRKLTPVDGTLASRLNQLSLTDRDRLSRLYRSLIANRIFSPRPGDSVLRHRLWRRPHSADDFFGQAARKLRLTTWASCSTSPLRCNHFGSDCARRAAQSR